LVVLQTSIVQLVRVTRNRWPLGLNLAAGYLRPTRRLDVWLATLRMPGKRRLDVWLATLRMPGNVLATGQQGGVRLTWNAVLGTDITYNIHRTSFDETTYMLHVPTDNAEAMNKAFLFLSDVAHALSFDPDAIEKERGVIIEEWRQGRGADARMQDRQFPILLAGSRYSERVPIQPSTEGEPAAGYVVDSITASPPTVEVTGPVSALKASGRPPRTRCSCTRSTRSGCTEDNQPVQSWRCQWSYILAELGLDSIGDLRPNSEVRFRRGRFDHLVHLDHIG
jgi:hypothetical protein